MKSRSWSRRFFLGASAALAGARITGGAAPAPLRKTTRDDRLALLGGTPVRSRPFPSWPILEDGDRKLWKEVLDSRRWNRRGGSYVERFEAEWRDRLGAKYVVGTSSGTSALYTSLKALGVGPGDEVLVPPYTFVATINVVLLCHALPVFVDSDRESSQMDASRIEATVSGRTRAVIPVHLGGNVCDMDRISEISRKRGLKVVEDACQAHLAEWRGRKVGTLGDLGCFSFQASKNLNCGEGGAISGDDPELLAICTSFQDAGRGYQANPDGRLERAAAPLAHVRSGDNRRMTEFQGALLLAQLQRLDDQTRLRRENAAYLTRLFEEIPGIEPPGHYDGCTGNAYHLYMFRYRSEAFAGLPRKRFLEALQAEGVRCSPGYRPLNREPFLERALQSRAFRRIYPERVLKEWRERNHCPENDRLCEEAAWLGQSVFLGSRSDMEEIATAVRKVSRLASTLVES